MIGSGFVFRGGIIFQSAERPILVDKGGNDFFEPAIDPSSNCEMCDCMPETTEQSSGPLAVVLAVDSDYQTLFCVYGDTVGVEIPKNRLFTTKKHLPNTVMKL